MELRPELLMKGFENMKKLRILEVYYTRRTSYYCSDWECQQVSRYFPNAFRFLRVDSYPYFSLPKTFCANNLVGLEMPRSNIEQFFDRKERKVNYLCYTYVGLSLHRYSSSIFAYFRSLTS